MGFTEMVWQLRFLSIVPQEPRCIAGRGEMRNLPRKPLANATMLAQNALGGMATELRWSIHARLPQRMLSGSLTCNQPRSFVGNCVCHLKGCWSGRLRATVIG